MLSVRARQEAQSIRCVVCHGDFAADPESWQCPSCATAYHDECADEVGRMCCLLGCSAVLRPCGASSVSVAGPAESASDGSGFSAMAEWVMRSFGCMAIGALLLAFALLGSSVDLKCILYGVGSLLVGLVNLFNMPS